MSHKDAPPETESQKACREWWEKARPTVKRAWGRAQDGSFLAEETRLIHQSWEAASQQANAEVERLRELCGMAYQLAGVHDAPEKWLDALSNAASGRPFSTDGLLPYMPQAVCEAEIRALELEREIEALRAEVAEWKRVAAAQAELHGEAEDRADKLEEELREAREFRDKLAKAIGNEQLRMFIEKHGEPVPLTLRVQAAEARAERLADALRELVGVFSESGMYDDEVFDKARDALAEEDE